MKLNLILLKDFVKDRKKQGYSIDNEKFDQFKESLEKYRSEIDLKDNEKTLQDELRDFLSSLPFKIKTEKERMDLSLWDKDNLKMIIEAKKPNSKDMVTDTELNKQSFREVIYYYQEQRNNNQNLIHSAMITDFQFGYFFEESELISITDSAIFKKAFKTNKTKESFYQEFQSKTINEEIKVIKFNLLDDDIEMLYYIFDERYIMHQSTKSDPNTLNQKFYNELLYIMGLEEEKKDKTLVKIKNKDKDKDKDKDKNTLIDLTMSNVKDFDTALSLNIVWLNRILFLKILESQLKVFRNDKDYAILNVNKVNDYSRLSKLFFKILSVPRENRLDEIDYIDIPYLNSSLFEKTELETRPEHDIIYLDKDKKVELPESSILYKGTNFKQKELPLLEYLLRFLDCYQFNSEEENQDSNTVIKSSVLGLVFEKLNGHKEGSHFTPASITMYMSKEVIQRRVLDVFNKGFSQTLQTYQGLCKWVKNNCVEGENLEKAHQLLNNISIIDPAVGSGHFLVSCLNELIRIKSDLGLLHDDIKVTIEDDELLIKYNDGKPFVYQIENNTITYKINEIQQTIFDTKKHIIENQLYGVDINPNSVNICRLRLWIELLKHTYYTNNTCIDLEILPNLEFKIMTANSLLRLHNHAKFLQNTHIQQYNTIMKDYFNSTTYYKTTLKNKAMSLISTIKESTLTFFDENNEADKAKFSSYNPFNIMYPSNFFDSSLMFGVEKFDIVIGNPPYVGNKDIPRELMNEYQAEYGEQDDLYNYFYHLGFSLLKQNGILGYITSNTFLTIQSKKKLRKYLQSQQLIEMRLIDNVFESAAVEPIIVIAYTREQEGVSENRGITEIYYDFDYIDNRGYEPLSEDNRISVNIKTYMDAPNHVFFTPNPYNLQIADRLFKAVTHGLNSYWDAIKTSANIEKHKSILDQEQRNKLKIGDIVLLGLLTDGGQGLATANNGYFIGVREGTKDAERTYQQRLKKIAEFNQEYDTSHDITTMSELEIRELFTKLKTAHGRDIFGQGFLYQIISDDEIADVSTLTQDEKMNGIDGERTFVPYDKGDKDGNRWYMPTVYCINWNIENVKFLKDNSGRKGEGMPVIRNPQFYFKEGFSWNNVLNPNSILIKARYKGFSVNDVASMSLYAQHDLITTKYLIVLINSYLIFYYLRIFINNTVSLQINDMRQVPIIIPTPEQLQVAEELFDRAKSIKEQQIAQTLTKEQADELLQDIQKEVDDYVERLYRLSEGED